MFSDEKRGAQLESREQSVCLSDIQWNSEQHTILIKDTTVTLTPVQYRLLAPLQYGRPVTYTKLAYLTYNCSIDKSVRKAIDKQIDRIRTKLYGTGVTIYCILRYGYVLLREDEEEPASM